MENENIKSLQDIQQVHGVESKPFFKIVIPCYNVSRSISNCLDSILMQSFDDYLIVCVDDFSTDSTRAVINNYVEKNPLKVRICSPIVKSKAGGARNYGYSFSGSSEYVWFVDGDDFLANNFVLEEAHNTIISNDFPDIVSVGYCSVNEVKKTITITSANNDDCLTEDKLLRSCAVWGKLIRYTKFIPFEEDLMYYEDVFQHILQLDSANTFGSVLSTCYVYNCGVSKGQRRFLQIPDFLKLAIRCYQTYPFKNKLSKNALKNKILLSLDKFKRLLA